MGEVEPRILPRDWLVHPKAVEQVVVRAVGRLPLRELERAQRVRDVLERVDDAVGVVIRRVDAPGVTRVRVCLVDDAVRGEIPHGRVLAEQVALVAKEGRPLCVPPLFHLPELGEVLSHGPITPRRSGTLRQRASLTCLEAASVVRAQQLARGLDLRPGLVAHVRTAVLDQLHRQIVQLLEVVGRVSHSRRLVAEPLEVVEDRVDELLLLGGRIGVVEAHHRGAALAHLARDARLPEVEVHRLSMPDVQVAVRFGREARPVRAARRFEVLLELCR